MTTLEQRPTTLRNLFQYNNLLYKPSFVVIIEKGADVMYYGFNYGIIDDVITRVVNIICNKENCTFFDEETFNMYNVNLYDLQDSRVITFKYNPGVYFYDIYEVNNL